MYSTTFVTDLHVLQQFLSVEHTINTMCISVYSIYNFF